MLRVFFDPAVASKPNNNRASNLNTPPPKPEKKSELGDYVEFEEVK